MKTIRIHHLVLSCLILSYAMSGWGYSIHSGLTDGCHERITRLAIQQVFPQLNPSTAIPIPTSKIWKKLANAILRDSEFNERKFQITDERFKLLFVSLVIGVRSPDTEGHAVTNLSSLRQIHADPSAEGQYAHALRGPDDDGTKGDESAIQGTRQAIIDLIRLAGESIRNKSPKKQIITVQLYFDFYGLVEIEVWEPAYLIGRSLHALQDSFAHTIRSDDLKRIRHVLNYVDAIAGDLKESVDGIAHSGFMDRCDGDTAVIAETAGIASAQLLETINDVIMMQDVSIIQNFLNEWMVYEPGCNIANDYCNSMWVTLARQEATGPYLEEFIGCDSSSSHKMSIIILLLFLGILINRHRQLLHGDFILVILLCSIPDLIHAQISIQSELHSSVLSDSANRSTLANTYGWGLRGAYHRGDWSALLHVEQNVWLTTELSDKTTDGVLNIGAGVAYIYGEQFVRSSMVIGSSTLLFDTLFDDIGTTGLFIDIRPVELRWFPKKWLALNLTPFSFTYISPVLEDPPIKMVLYRTVFAVEGKF